LFNDDYHKSIILILAQKKEGINPPEHQSS